MRDVKPGRHVVRRLASNTTHVMEVKATVTAHSFGSSYPSPAPGQALCGVHIEAGSVVMKPHTKIGCRACKHLSGLTEEAEDA